jgi:signal peptidase I
MPAFPAPLASPSARLTLGSDEYLVLGDNTRNSLDGRYFGPVKRSAIVGKVFYIYAPAGRKQRIE